MNEKHRAIKNASWVATIGNAILAIAKIFVGIISGSFAVVGDGIDTATDIITSFIGVITSKIISRKPNKKYSYGYEKAEAVSTKILSFIIFFAGLQLIYSSIKKIFEGSNHEVPGVIAIYITIVSIVVKIMLTLYGFKIGQKYNSSILIANAKNMRNDILISASVLLSLFFSSIFQIGYIDLIAGLFIGFYILKIGFEIFNETKVELMDGLDDTSIYSKVFEIIKSEKGIFNPHRTRIRKIGSHYMISIDVEIDGDVKLRKAHDMVCVLEEKIKKKIDRVYDIRVHIEPLGDKLSKEKFGICRKDC